MAPKQVLKLLAQAERLTTDEQLELASKLVEKARQANGEPKSSHTSHKWSTIKGIAPDLLADEDAQEWVSRTRRAGGNRHRLDESPQGASFA